MNEIYALPVDFYLLTECLRNNKALQDSMQVERRLIASTWFAKALNICLFRNLQSCFLKFFFTFVHPSRLSNLKLLWKCSTECLDWLDLLNKSLSRFYLFAVGIRQRYLEKNKDTDSLVSKSNTHTSCSCVFFQFMAISEKRQALHSS